MSESNAPRNLLAFSAVLAAAVLGYRLFVWEPAPSRPAEAPELDVGLTQSEKIPPRSAPSPTGMKRSAQATSVRTMPANIPARAQGKSALPFAAMKPEGNIVEFQVIHGFAVAYGDIILGRPMETIPGGRGRYEMPPLQLWSRPEIPYVIHPDLPQPERVERALQYLRENTPVNFVPHQGESDAIVFEPGPEHCMSPLGKQGGIQAILLSPGCGTHEVLHEILHALGFVHEQSRVDRDQHIEIQWKDIDPKYHEQFAMVPEPLQEPMRGTPFDYRSVLLYESTAFASAPSRVSMRSRGQQPISPVKNGLSAIDIQRLNRMFLGHD